MKRRGARETGTKIASRDRGPLKNAGRSAGVLAKSSAGALKEWGFKRRGGETLERCCRHGRKVGGERARSFGSEKSGGTGGKVYSRTEEQ